MADFVKLNGYNVKDSNARTRLDSAESTILADEKINKATQLINSMNIVIEERKNKELLGTIAGGDGYTLQGACLLPNGNHLLGFQNTTNKALSVLVEIIPSSYTVVGRHVLDVGHVNDLTINAKTGYLYCACGRTGEGNNGGKLAEIDLNNWAIINTYDFGLSSGAMWFCSYDPISELMMVSDYVRLLMIDENMEVTSNVPCNFDQGTNYGAIVKQSTTFYKGSLLVLNFLTTSQTQWYPILAHMVSTWNPYTGELINTKTIPNDYGFTEIENMIVDGDKIIGYAQGEQFSRWRFTTPTTGGYSYKDAKVGLYIPENSNLNDYLTEGKYTVFSGTIASTIQNTPFTTGAYDLTVRGIDGGAIEQRVTGAYGLLGKAAVRLCDPSSGKWTIWRYDVQSYGWPYIIQTGGILIDVTPGVITTRKITFNQKMSNPSIFLQLSTSSTATEMAKITAITDEITDTGFTIRMYSEAENQRSPFIRWLAIGHSID